MKFNSEQLLFEVFFDIALIYGSIFDRRKSGTELVEFIHIQKILPQIWFYAIGSVHLSESGTIAAFRVEKGESQLDEKGNVVNTFDQLLTCRIDIYSPFRHYHSHSSQFD